jgi:hypothetical protein
MRLRNPLSNFAFLPLLFLGLLTLTAADSLESGFQNPPPSARPQTWWHWMNGNITREGITADLEAMQRVGIGGAEIFNADCGIPAGPVKFLSPEWRDLMRFAAQEANRLGLELCLHNCAGWSSSGGPWNTPEHAMQRVTTSELAVTGPAQFSGVLPAPPQQLGFYRDIAVLAFRTPGFRKKPLVSPKVAGGEAGANAGPIRPVQPPLKIENIDAKAGFNGDFIMSDPAAAEAAPDRVVRHAEILDLTAHLKSGGRLDWHVPAGGWTILRLGYTPIGVKNHPAPAEATGLECDKFSREALDAHWAGFVQKVLDDLGPLAGEGKAFNDVLIDSYEVGGQNWSPDFRAEFQKRRGYDPLLYLPTLTGRVVDNPQTSERFLWDMRRTIADLFAENYYGHFQELCHQHGLKASIEPYTGPFDSLQCGEKADIPMGEFWVGGAPDSSVKLAASVGHIYGRPVIGAESFTAAPGPQHGRWLEDPYSLKTLGDLVFCQGVNRYIFHRYAMQPWTNRWPGMTMGQWGTHFDRTSTWFEQGRAWLQYVARCQYLLQQGHFVADAAYFCGESAPVELRVGEPGLPPGYDYDAINAGVLLHHADMQDGRLTLESGVSYRLLILPPSERAMAPALLRKLAGFVEAGLILVGAPPQASPSLENYPLCDTAVRQLAHELWGECDGRTVTEHPYGKGKIVWGRPLVEVLRALDVKPDFDYAKANGAQLAYIHRRSPSNGDQAADIYFVSNQQTRYRSVECRFRMDGLVPELWDPQTGQIGPAPVWRHDQGRTVVPLSLDPAGSVFVVFRARAAQDHLVSVEREAPKVTVEPEKTAELRILKAAYGAFASHEPKWLDVTDEVKSLVADGTHEIPAENDMAGDDPAPNIVKELRIKFRVNGQERTVSVKEGQKATLHTGSEIVEARYGELRQSSSGVDRTVDVTAKLNRLIKGGQLNVSADNALAGNDPAGQVPKELRVEYSLDGVVKNAVAQENETLALPDTGQGGGRPPAFGFVTGADGRMRLLAYAPGTFSFKWDAGREAKTECATLPPSLALAGPWDVSFPPGWGAPDRLTFERLQSWTENSDAGVKYFSGTATYRKDFEIPAELLATNRALWLDLGGVKNFAEVSLNGQPLGLLWKPPFRVDVTAVAKTGTNNLEVKVTNLWPNRLIGDEQLPADCEWKGKQLKTWPQWLLDGKPSPTGRVTFTTWHHWKKTDHLLESGLLGPVVLRVAEEIEIH